MHTLRKLPTTRPKSTATTMALIESSRDPAAGEAGTRDRGRPAPFTIRYGRPVGSSGSCRACSPARTASPQSAAARPVRDSNAASTRFSASNPSIASSCCRRRTASLRNQSSASLCAMCCHIWREAFRSPPCGQRHGGQRRHPGGRARPRATRARTTRRPSCSPRTTSSGRSRAPGSAASCRAAPSTLSAAARWPGRAGPGPPGGGSARKIAPN